MMSLQLKRRGSGAQCNAEAFKPGAIVHPTKLDIILGRGILHANHPGNVRFYTIIDQYLPIYDAAKSRTDKTKIVETIYEIITSEGRFVKDDAESAACVVVETKKAKKKISHAIRFRRQAAALGKPLSSQVRSTTSASPSSSQELTGGRPQPGRHKALEQEKDFLRDLLVKQNFSPSNWNERKDDTLDCIIPDEDLDSVLLLPQEEMELVSEMYDGVLWGDLREDEPPGRATPVAPSMKLRHDYHKQNKTNTKPFQSQLPVMPRPDIRPLPLPPCFAADPLPLPECFAHDDLAMPPSFSSHLHF